MRTTTIIAPLETVRVPAPTRSKSARFVQGALFAVGLLLFGIGVLTVGLLSLPVRLFHKIKGR